MAKIRGPLLSQHVTGTVAGMLTFQQTARGFKCYLKSVPPDNPTSAQLRNREMFGVIQNQLATFGTPYTAEFQPYADLHQLTNANAYAAINMDRWKTGRWPSWSNPPNLNGGGATPLTLSAVGHSGFATVTFTADSPQIGFGTVIFRGPTNNFTCLTTNAVKIIPLVPDDGVYVFDDPAPPGTYFYRATSWSLRGILAGLRTSSSTVVT